jgi:hypothetical protein
VAGTVGLCPVVFSDGASMIGAWWRPAWQRRQREGMREQGGTGGEQGHRR